MFETFLQAVSLNFIAVLSMIVILLLAVELMFYFVPGVSISSLLIAMASVHLGFLPVLMAGLVGIGLAHFIIRRDFTVVLIAFIILIPMTALGAFLGPEIIEYFGAFGWPMLGILMGITKWGCGMPIGFILGRNMSKRSREIILEPVFNFFIFWKLRFLLMFLFK